MPRGVRISDSKTAEQWEAQKERIVDLHVVQNHTLSKVCEVLRDEGFNVTEPSVKKRLKLWKVSKNVFKRQHRAPGQTKRPRPAMNGEAGDTQILSPVVSTAADVENSPSGHQSEADQAIFEVEPASPVSVLPRSNDFPYPLPPIEVVANNAQPAPSIESVAANAKAALHDVAQLVDQAESTRGALSLSLEIIFRAIDEFSPAANTSAFTPYGRSLVLIQQRKALLACKDILENFQKLLAHTTDAVGEMQTAIGGRSNISLAEIT